MRTIIAATLALGLATAASAQAPATPAPAKTQAAAQHYTTEDTDLGTLLGDPAAKAILVKYLPDLVKSEQIDMARSMTLRGMQQYASDMLTDQKLTAIDAEFAKLPVKK